MAVYENKIKTNNSSWVYKSKNFELEATVDYRNKRIWVIRCQYQDIMKMQDYLHSYAVESGLEKIILPVIEQKEENYGLFKPEGRIKGYFNGKDTVFLAGYTHPRRGFSPNLTVERKLLDDVMKKEYKKIHHPKGYEFRNATRDDTKEMTEVFSKVFETYPSPVFKPEYLIKRMEDGDIFWLAIFHGKIVAISSAEIDYRNSRAEMTDFATLPDYRGQELASVLMDKMGKECRGLGINCLFSLARASSFGMNSVFYRHGFVFGGTLTNNCDICGGYENMNIWYLYDIAPTHDLF